MSGVAPEHTITGPHAHYRANSGLAPRPATDGPQRGEYSTGELRREAVELRAIRCCWPSFSYVLLQQDPAASPGLAPLAALPRTRHGHQRGGGRLRRADHRDRARCAGRLRPAVDHPFVNAGQGGGADRARTLVNLHRQAVGDRIQRRLSADLRQELDVVPGPAELHPGHHRPGRRARGRGVRLLRRRCRCSARRCPRPRSPSGSS